MHQNLTTLFLFCSLYGATQLYIAEGTVISLGVSDTQADTLSPQAKLSEEPKTTHRALLSSQEFVNQINAPITGGGILYLNGMSTQTLSSTQPVLELPTLHLKNSDLVQIETILNIKNQMGIERGTLTLSHNLVLHSTTALVLGTDAKIHATANGQIVYKTQFQKSQPLAALLRMPLLKDTGLKTFQIYPKIYFVFKHSSNLGIIAKDYFIQPLKPPPEKRWC